MVVELTPEWLEVEQQSGGRFVLAGSADDMTKQIDALVQALLPLLPGPDPDVNREDKTVNGVPVRIYTPPNASGKSPVGIYTHGGGYAIGNLDSETLLCDAISKYTSSVLVSVDYRLAPKHKHPAALDDSTAVWNWAWDNADALGGDKTKYFSIGVSAGGALALSVANKLVADPKTRAQIKGCVAMVPMTMHPSNVPSGYETAYNAMKENSDAPIIDANSMNSFYEWVGSDPKDADNFVALAEKNHQYFPPTYIVACEADPLRDDAVILEKLLKKAGVKTQLDMYKALPHCFWVVPQIAEGKTFVENLLKGMHFVLSS